MNHDTNSNEANLLQNPAPMPSGDGCKECLENKTWWFHLRRCLECGHIGCCDSSPNQHARHHWEETGHRFLTTFEPEELWLWDYETDNYSNQPMPDLAPPLHHPLDQSIPGPGDIVPDDWQDKLH